MTEIRFLRKSYIYINYAKLVDYYTVRLFVNSINPEVLSHFL